ncbi:hypothetical protein RF55_6305 [Lasius niger]|uniref:Uncharacterized protein n=1 Tax=Lasius niger TaxID=67767 RepID=A0A0J7NM97_LASNI|nr:hypothetical protein RF55_6305 [Lasius niger]
MVSANRTSMIPANVDAREEVVEVPMASPAPKEPEAREEPEALEEPEAPEEEPEVPKEVTSQATDDNDAGEQTAPDEGGTQQQSAVVLNDHKGGGCGDPQGLAGAEGDKGQEGAMVLEEPEVSEKEPEVPEDPNKGHSQATDDNNVGEETAPDEGGSQQQSAIVLNHGGVTRIEGADVASATGLIGQPKVLLTRIDNDVVQFPLPQREQEEPPRQSDAKRDLPKVGDLQRELVDLAHWNIQKRAVSSLIFLDKLASPVELTRLDIRFKEANEYLVKKIGRLEGELGVARSEIVSLRASLSPAGQSLPRKRVRSSGDELAKERGTMIKIEQGGSHPSLVPLPDSPAAERIMVDRGYSPICGVDATVVPPLASGGKAGTSRTDAGAAPLEDRDLTALEQSLLEHINALFAQKSSLQEDIGRIRKNLDEPRKESLPTAGQRRATPGTPVTGGKTKKKKRKGKDADFDTPYARPQASQAVVDVGARVRGEPTTSAIADERWTEVIGRKAKRAARREHVQRIDPLLYPW